MLTVPDRSAEEAIRARVQPGGWNASQHGVAMATGPLGGSFSGLQGVRADLRSEAKVYVQAGGGRGSGRVGGERGLRFCGSNELPGDADDAGPGGHTWRGKGFESTMIFRTLRKGEGTQAGELTPFHFFYHLVFGLS